MHPKRKPVSLHSKVNLYGIKMFQYNGQRLRFKNRIANNILYVIDVFFENDVYTLKEV